ncbi:MAG: hypothetical protein LBT84_05240, partial [Spirochaetia bacterium]|nr:hypothetical protein [Spirochaetia bacterium]
MRKIDDTKKTIGIKQLSDDERKRLFANLQKAGGQVINDTPVKKHVVIDRDKQMQYKTRIEEHQRNMKNAAA